MGLCRYKIVSIMEQISSNSKHRREGEGGKQRELVHLRWILNQIQKHADLVTARGHLSVEGVGVCGKLAPVQQTYLMLSPHSGWWTPALLFRGQRPRHPQPPAATSRSKGIVSRPRFAAGTSAPPSCSPALRGLGGPVELGALWP